MSTDIVRATPVATNLPDMVRYAEHLAKADMLPKGFAGRPANVLYAMEYGRTLGITPLAALTGIHVIEGKPSASSGLIGALVRQAGHKLRVKGDGRTATAQIIRADDPEWTYECTWDLERAEQAGLCQIKNGKPWARDRNGKPTAWEKYPAAMLKARAITEVARDACEDVLFGLHYTPEELGAYVDQDGNPVDAPVQPLRSVPSESVTVQDVAADSQQAAEDAAHTTDASVVRQIWQAAGNAGLLEVPVQTPLGSMSLREYLVARGGQLTAAGPVDAEIVEDEAGPTQPPASTLGSGTAGAAATAPVAGSPTRDRDAALDALRGAAIAAGVADTIEADFLQSYGVDISRAELSQLAEMAEILRRAAA
ncbi:hypothetical protein [Kitasatospora sp. A2-31]|uniref:hypothetical protein n=1 Tax=Kitasatospora sp. A2-31 TaxID=2916414 RepID=UPI001EE9598E|nr:hypothetical protein [Kitasatospora sp. A2-31]MCG6493387.1 hypothetical protein [Kitasatospora sp. A2-31]